VEAFSAAIFQWASTLTTSAANYPFSLPLKVDKLGNGFTLSLMRAGAAGVGSAGDLHATVEEVDGQGNVLFVRFYEGSMSFAGRTPPTDPQRRLDVALESLVDVTTIMQSMPAAIRSSVRSASA
jgi:hypothetical protein